jgi:serine/threonine-protein kinase
VKELGRGAQGTVLLCTHEGEQRAVKVIEFDNPADTDMGSVTTCMNSSDLAKEVETAELGAKLGDKGVPAFFEASEGELVGSGCHALLLIVTEFIDGVTLGAILEAADGQALPDECVRVVGKDVLRTLSRMHEKGLIHRDIKPDNILISRKGKAYLCDFGVSQVINNRRPEDTEWPEAWAEIAGSPLYMAPETYTRCIDFKVDIWAVGMVLYEMMSGSHPLEEELGSFPPRTIIPKLMEIKPPSVYDIKSWHSEALKEQVQSMLNRDQRKRPSAKELIDPNRSRGLMFGLMVRNGDRATLAKWCNDRPS